MADVASVMRECNNYFVGGYRDAVFTISDGALVDDLLTPGQYIAISGSWLNNGVHVVGDALQDETFVGRVWYLRPPPDFLSLCDDIAQYDQNAPVSAYASESFGGYSYTRATGENGAPITWQGAFSARLRPFRRMFSEVDV